MTAEPKLLDFGITRSEPDERVHVRAFSRPYAHFHDPYQRYYTHGLRLYSEDVGADFRAVPLSRFPRFLRSLKRIRDAGYATRLRVPGGEAVLDRVAHRLEGPIETPSGYFHTVTGQYLALMPTGELRRFCIDAQDSHELASEELLQWCDVYFKTNRWSGVEYPANVAPMVNADPFVIPRIDELRALRGARKEFDLCFVTRIWGGANELEGIEHNLRLVEAVNRVRCKKQVLAVVLAGDVPQILRRLERARIPASTRGISAGDLWRLTGSSRLNIFRLGLHYCVPWRMTGSLAVGSCVVLDRPPFSIWPEPLREGVNYLSLGTCVGPGSPTAESLPYDEIPDRIEAWLARPQEMDEIGRANADYFDAFLHPRQVGAEIMRAVASSGSLESPPM